MNTILSKLLGDLTNIIDSPFLIWEILTMLRHGVRGESGQELENFLQFLSTDIGISGNDLENLKQKYFLAATTDISKECIAPPVHNTAANVLSPSCTETKNIWIANRIFVKSGVRLSRNFINVLKQQFACGMQELDFCAPLLAAEAINQWVKRVTNERIPAIISSNDVGPDTQVVLANAIYFKAQWKQQFEPVDTKTKPFYIDAQRSVLVPMMSQVISARYAYLPDHGVKVVELPYRDTDLAMLVILPTDVLADFGVLTNLSLPSAVDQLVFRKVYVKLPKFTFGCTIDVHSLLAKFGVRGIFNDSKDFNSLVEGNIFNFGVSKIIQQAFIKVSEEGTEAAAATACCIDGAISFEEEFIANRPFYFCIKNRSCLKLFEGCYLQPN
ncbi:serine protease inhibitor 42Dd-like [Rhagoletis pomonella]|uniref:serine protease inhibitor 42Dd-like n=1 Tax=Rhagoletis pomonella TaxID=28610 RepID=UPI0017824B03|nr:serine protease inhibitor 42Dd-like [Rhagoletis pomonella]